jgi:hypothetical protein
LETVVVRVGRAAAALAVLTTLAPSAVGAASGCWKPVTIPAGETVGIAKPKEGPAELLYLSSMDITVRLPDGQAAPASMARDSLAELATVGGQLLVQKGTFQLSHETAAYELTASTPGLEAQAGMLIKAPDVLAGGRLPAGQDAVVVFENGHPIRARLAAPVALWPVPPSTRIAAPDVGQLPITRGGRVLEVEFSVPGRTEDQLRTEPFQACLSPRPPPPRSTAMDNVTPKNASVRLVDVRDGSVTLAVTMPDAVDTLFSIYQPVQIEIMGPRLGVLSEPASVYIGNPLLAFIVAVLAIGLLVWLLAYWLRDKLNKPGDQGSEGSRWEWLIGFIRGLDGEPSLSLFQIGIWTLLGVRSRSVMVHIRP